MLTVGYEDKHHSFAILHFGQWDAILQGKDIKLSQHSKVEKLLLYIDAAK